MEVFVHVGAVKTGTSTIQSALVTNRAALHAAGLAYPKGIEQHERRAARGELTSGNAKDLAWRLGLKGRPANFDDAAAEAWLDRGLAWAGGRTVLYSTESMQGMPRRMIEELDALFRRRGARVHIIYYVRHLLDQAVSSFCQKAKTGLLAQLAPEERSLDGYIAHYASPSFRQLRAFADALGGERVHCRLYDHERRDLLGSILEVVAPGRGLSTVLAPEAGGLLVNRSPTALELAQFLALNDLPDAELVCRTLSDALLNQPPALAAPLHVGEAAWAAFAARNQPVLDQVNARFLPPATPLQMTSGAIGIGTPPAAADAEVAASHRAMIVALARRAAADRRTAERLASKLAATPRPKSAEALPRKPALAGD